MPRPEASDFENLIKRVGVDADAALGREAAAIMGQAAAKGALSSNRIVFLFTDALEEHWNAAADQIMGELRRWVAQMSECRPQLRLLAESELRQLLPTLIKTSRVERSAKGFQNQRMLAGAKNRVDALSQDIDFRLRQFDIDMDVSRTAVGTPTPDSAVPRPGNGGAGKENLGWFDLIKRNPVFAAAGLVSAAVAGVAAFGTNFATIKGFFGSESPQIVQAVQQRTEAGTSMLVTITNPSEKQIAITDVWFVVTNPAEAEIPLQQAFRSPPLTASGDFIAVGPCATLPGRAPLTPPVKVGGRGIEVFSIGLPDVRTDGRACRLQLQFKTSAGVTNEATTFAQFPTCPPLREETSGAASSKGVVEEPRRADCPAPD